MLYVLLTQNKSCLVLSKKLAKVKNVLVIKSRDIILIHVGGCPATTFHLKGRFFISQNLMSRIIVKIYTVTDIMPMELQNSHRKVKSVITIHHDEKHANTYYIDSIHM